MDARGNGDSPSSDNGAPEDGDDTRSRDDRGRLRDRSDASRGNTRAGVRLEARVAGGVDVTCPSCGEGLDAPTVRLDLVGFAGGMELLLVNPRRDLPEILDDVRRAVVAHALRQAGGVQKDAARRVGMKYSTFHDLVQRLGIDANGS